MFLSGRRSLVRDQAAKATNGQKNGSAEESTGRQKISLCQPRRRPIKLDKIVIDRKNFNLFSIVTDQKAFRMRLELGLRGAIFLAICFATLEKEIH